MDAKTILDDLLARSQQATRAGIEMIEASTSTPAASAARMALLKGAGAGALGAGAVALLFGSKGARKFAKKAAEFGGTAALGGLAYKAYTDWQSEQRLRESSTGTPTASGTLNLAQFEMGVPLEALTEDKASTRSEALMRAMISAARVDGHVDEAEMRLITRRIDELALEQDVTRFLISEMSEPVDATRIAALADTRETAAELYLASALVADLDDPEASAYLASLATALALDPDVVRRLEAPLQT